MSNQYVSIHAGQPLTATQQANARTNIFSHCPTYGSFSGLPSATDNPGSLVYVTEGRCTMVSAGGAWVQQSVGNFTYAELKALTAANFSGIKVRCSDYNIECVGDGVSRFVARAPFTLFCDPGNADQVTGHTNEEILRPVLVPYFLLPAIHSIYMAPTWNTVPAGNRPRMRLNTINSLTGATGGHIHPSADSTTGTNWEKTLISTSGNQRTGGGQTSAQNSNISNIGAQTNLAFSNDYYILFTSQLASSGSLSILQSLNVRAQP